jgi:hypothetical protein
VHAGHLSQDRYVLPWKGGVPAAVLILRNIYVFASCHLPHA